MLIKKVLWPRSLLRRSLETPSDADFNDRRNVEVEIPAGNGVGTARPIARAYSALAEGGAELGLTHDHDARGMTFLLCLVEGTRGRMPWKIVNLDYACDRPHLHIKDPNAPIHLRTYFDERRVEIGLGDDEPDFCFVRAAVSPDAVVVEATRFEALHVQILRSIFASLDVEPDERDEALAWMTHRMDDRRAPVDEQGFWLGNVTSFPAPTGWPYDLTDDALMDSIRDSEAIPATRKLALHREAVRRGLRSENRGRPGPEVLRRR